jgi:D-inositol-3-phosphate glycosyltransferase
MSARRVAMLSLHTSPLAQPGTGDGGGMNIYVRSLASALARAGVDCDVLARAEHRGAAPVVEVEPGVRVVHLDAGPRRAIPKDELLGLHDELVAAAESWLESCGRADVLHANYWVSGSVAHTLKHRLGLPMVATFHTLAWAKADAGILDDPLDRMQVERDVVRCADGVVVSTREERDLLIDEYDAAPDRVEIIPPGVDHTVFAPGDASRTRRHWRAGADPVLLFVGRIQPLKGVDVAVRCLAALEHPRAQLVVVGGPSGAEGDAELARLRTLACELGIADRVRFEPPRAHDALAAYYRAADVVLVPSRTESFGLVALEAAACGTPVVASAVGGLRSVVEHGVSGYLVNDRDPAEYAALVDDVLRNPSRTETMRTQAVTRARQYTWSIAAARLRRLYADVPARELVRCT